MVCLHLWNGKKQNETEPGLGYGNSKDYLVVGFSFSENSVKQRWNKFIKRQQLLANKTYSLTVGCQGLTAHLFHLRFPECWQSCQCTLKLQNKLPFLLERTYWPPCYRRPQINLSLQDRSVYPTADTKLEIEHLFRNIPVLWALQVLQGGIWGFVAEVEDWSDCRFVEVPNFLC